MDRTYLCIDLKSFYASVECVTRGLDPLTTNLVVADVGRTEKTICLAVTPSLKAYGIPGRARLFEVIQKVEQINRQRKYKAPRHKLDCESYNAAMLARNPSLALSYIAAPQRMAYYMEYSTRIYNIYLKYIAPEDIHVYSIDEVFIDLTHYLSTYKCTARELAQTMIKDVLANTGITATAGIGTNMYLAKIAMDITAKKMPADENGVRIAELDEMSYRKDLWTHKPLTDFWMLGSGIAKKLEANYMYRVRLYTGESQRPNGTYMYRWTDAQGKRHYIYAPTLEKLREEEKLIIVDEHDGIKQENKLLTLNDLFELWKDTKRGIKDSTFQNYIYMYNLIVAPNFGKNRVQMIKKSDVKKFYNRLADGKRMQIATIDNI